MTLDELNAMPVAVLGDTLRRCCGSSAWIEVMIERRPYSSVEDLLEKSDAAWKGTDENDWLEAFAHHPRIGQTHAAGWAGGEQSRVQDATMTVQEDLAKVNREYEARFGHIYIVCATGKSAEEMLDDARARMMNDSAAELRVAATEQHKITQLRLIKLLGENS